MRRARTLPPLGFLSRLASRIARAGGLDLRPREDHIGVAKPQLDRDRSLFLSDQRTAILKARTRAFRFPKGQSGNPSGQSRFYHEARKIARQASPQAMRDLVELSRTAEDERVRAVCLTAVLDRGGVRPIDYDPAEERQAKKPEFDPRDYTEKELDQIESALRLIVARNAEKRAAAPAGAAGRGGSSWRTELVG
jgi:hypothetical protein